MSSFPKSTSQQIVDKYFVITKDYFEAIHNLKSIQIKLSKLYKLPKYSSQENK